MTPFVEFLDYLIRGNPPGVQRRLVHTWPWPHALAIILLLVAIAIVVAIYWRERSPGAAWRKSLLLFLRASVVTLTIIGLMYGWMLARDVTDLPDLILVIDDSASMLHADADTRRGASAAIPATSSEGELPGSRWAVAKRLLLEGRRPLLAELQARYNVQLYRIAATVRQENAHQQELAELLAQARIDAREPLHASSRLGAGLRTILENQRGRPTAAVVMFTDGITTEGRTLSETANYAQRMEIPLFLVGLGDDKPAKDVRLTDLMAEEVVFVGDLAHFDAKFSAPGFEGKSITFQLTRSGDSTPLATRQVVVGRASDSQSVRLSYRPLEVGDYEFAVEAVPPPGDSSAENNRLVRNVSVRDETIRVLYVQEYPSFEYRYLKTLLERGLKRSGDGTEKAIDLTVILQEADLEYATIDASAARVFPVSRDELFAYDVIIFGDVNPAFFSESQLESLADFVRERGGGLIFASGTRHTPLAYRSTALADLMPIQLEAASIPPEDALLDQPLSVRPTALGTSSPVTQLTEDPAANSDVWQSLPPIYWTVAAPEIKAGARILVEAAHPQRGTQPIVGMQFIGAGKVLMVLTDETYRWAHHPAGDRYYQSFWLQMIRYLSRAKLLGTGRAAEFSTDRESYRLGDPVALRVRFLDDRLAPEADDGVTVVLEQEGGGRRRVTLHRDSANRGLFLGMASRLTEGNYRAWLAEPAPAQQPAATRFTIQAAQGEQGRLEMDAAGLRDAAQLSRGKFFTVATAAELLDDLPEGRQVRVESLPPKPLWNSSFVATLFVVLLVSEWILRKRSGMV